VPSAFERIVRAIRPLMEAEECRVAITAAGCATWTQPDGTVDVWTDESHGLVRENGCTWSKARDWAEAQAAKREEAQWSPEVTDGMWEDDVCERVCDVLAYCHPRGRKDPAWLCGRASAMGRYDHERLRIWLGKGDMPKTT